MNEEKAQAIEMSRALAELQAKILEHNYRLKSKLQSLTPADAADIGYLLREAEDHLDELRKDCKALKDLIGRILCVQLMTRFEQDPTFDLSARGTLATATADVKLMPLMPKKGSEEFLKLMRLLGVTNQETIERGLVTVHFTHMAEYLSEAAERGLPVPAGLLKTLPNPQCIFRKKAK